MKVVVAAIVLLAAGSAVAQSQQSLAYSTVFVKELDTLKNTPGVGAILYALSSIVFQTVGYSLTIFLPLIEPGATLINGETSVLDVYALAFDDLLNIYPPIFEPISNFIAHTVIQVVATEIVVANFILSVLELLGSLPKIIPGLISAL